MDANAKRGIFAKFSAVCSRTFGSSAAFSLASALVAVWLATGPLFDFSDSWQLVINTGTTVVTFLMVFLLQSSQNRDTRALQLKLDELIRAVKGARNELVDLEEMSDAELDKLQREFKELHDQVGVQPRLSEKGRQNASLSPAKRRHSEIIT